MWKNRRKVESIPLEEERKTRPQGKSCAFRQNHRLDEISLLCFCVTTYRQSRGAAAINAPPHAAVSGMESGLEARGTARAQVEGGSRCGREVRDLSAG